MDRVQAKVESDLAEKASDLPVRDWLVRTGLDATEDPAVWVWATLEGEPDLAARDAIRDRVREVVRDTTDWWVYVLFRGVGDPEP
jgi:hypothetical protein